MADLKLKAIITVADKASGPLREINRNISRSSAPLQRLSRQLKTFDRVSGLKNMRRAIGGLAKGFGILAGSAVAAAVGVVGALNKMAAHGDSIAKNARLFGISTKALQEWQFIADRSGVTTDQLNTSFIAFTKRMGEMRAGTGGLFTLLKKINPQLSEQLLNAKGNTEAFELMIGTMQRLKNPQQRAALAAAAFSRAGVQLAKIADNSSEKLAGMREEANALGFVLGDKTLADSEKFKDSMTNFNAIMQGIGFTIGSVLMPEIIAMVGQFKNWFLANKEIIKQDLQDFAKKLVDGIRSISKSLTETLPKIGEFVDSIGGIKTIFIALGVILLAPFIAAVVSLAGAFVSLGITIAALSAPVLVFIAGVTAIVGGLILLNSWFKDGAPAWVTSWSGLWDGIKSVISDGVSWIKAKFDLLPEAAKSWAGIWDFVKEKWLQFASWVLGVFSNKLKSALQIAQNIAGLFGGSLGANAGAGTNTALPQQRRSIISSRQKTDVGGTIKIKIDSTGQVRVEKLKPNNPDVGFNVDAGLNLAAAG